MKLLKQLAVISTAFFFSQTFAQNNEGRISGNFDVMSQFYREDTLIGAPDVPEKVLMNAFANLNYVKGDFSAGIRYESYEHALLGFNPLYQGSDLTYRYARYRADNLDITVGNFYEQFGNGQTLRAYEERALGLDNMIDGVRAKYYLNWGELTGLVGKQRWYFEKGPGIVRGFDAIIRVNDIFESMTASPTRIILGGSVVSKFQEDNDPAFTLPENVLALDYRFQVLHKGLQFNAEYTFKYNDPSADNLFIYKEGQMLSLNAAYSKKGFGVVVSAHTLDNMFFRSDRYNSSQFQDLFINYIPALTKQHTYNLMATLYPYATQPRGEMAFQVDVTKKLKKGSLLGGKKGASLAVNFSWINSIDTTNLNDLETTRQGYTSNMFTPGETKYFQDFNIEFSKKLNKSNKIKLTYQNLFYNIDIIQGKPGKDPVLANVGVVDWLHKLNKKHSIRTELQGLFTEQDQGSWATMLVEYTYSPHWFVAFLNQYNYGNKDEGDRIHYPNLSVGYVKDASRITIGYGRQREGIFCVGGVCRVVPASNGLTVSLTTSF